ncbi:hypothetical protein [Streptomyces poonensis]|uniref:Uncharacterized protein n=1 Tax=Streptomyces poonensis TaxID=68255 RepID=A0A918QF21_9ACTN|nr:hypothetical protein [Streptomyces poonensis]GGZ44309.1 hypothetical protein GCM10010365_75930 [Streptomyces poonensis]
MSEQWAGVVGAVAGGVLAGVPALLGAWWSRRSQREQIRGQQVLMAGQLQSAQLLQVMEPRRRVYGDFIATVHHVRTKLFEAWRSGPGDGHGRLLLVLEDEELSERLERVRAQVALEGPEAVVEAAESVMDLLSATHARIASLVESGILDEFAAAGEEIPLPPEVVELKQRLDRMITAAREALAQYGAAALLSSEHR